MELPWKKSTALRPNNKYVHFAKKSGDITIKRPFLGPQNPIVRRQNVFGVHTTFQEAAVDLERLVCK